MQCLLTQDLLWRVIVACICVGCVGAKLKYEKKWRKLTCSPLRWVKGREKACLFVHHVAALGNTFSKDATAPDLIMVVNITSLTTSAVYSDLLCEC